MRLVIDGRRLTATRTGVGRYLEILLREWAASGWPQPETRVVLADPAGLAQVPKSQGVEAVVVGANWPGLVWERFALGRSLRPGDVLFAPTNLVPASWSGPTVLVAFDTLLEQVPDSFPWHVRARFRGRYRRASARADRVITPSWATWRDVAKFHGVAADRLRMIAPAIDPAFRPQGPGSAEVRAARGNLGLGAEPYFLFVGKPSRRRHLPEVIAAFAVHRANHPHHRLVFVGPGHDQTLQEDGVVVAGHVDEPTLRGLLADATALLYPSEHEGFGLPVAEALACGCPVVTLRRPALVEAGGDAAWYLDEATPAALAEAMHVLAVDIASRATRMSRGFSHAARFRPGRFADEVRAEIRALAHVHEPAVRGPRAASAGRRSRQSVLTRGRGDR